MIKMIVAVDRNNAIGWTDGRLPWHIKADLMRFKELTTGNTVLMGRKTFDSLKRPNGLPNRANLVLTHHDQPYEFGPNVVFFHASDKNSLKELCDVHELTADHDLWIIGGAQIYEQALALKIVDEIHLTVVDTDSGADVTLSYDLSSWKLFTLGQRKDSVEWSLEDSSEQQHTEEGLGYTFITLKRIR